MTRSGHSSGSADVRFRIAASASSRGARSSRSLIELAVVVDPGRVRRRAFEALRRRRRQDRTRPRNRRRPRRRRNLPPIVDLPPIVTNLGAPQDIWVRLEGSIVFDPRALPHPEVVAGKIGDDILAYLRTVSLRQLEGPIGLENIRQDLNERAATRSDGKVREFVIRTLVVQ